MARAYSNDLRRKFLQAYDEGEDTLEELAEQFRVSLGWAKKISARRSRTGEVDAPVWRHGPVSRVTPKFAAFGNAAPRAEAKRLRQCAADLQSGALKRGTSGLDRCT